MSTSRLFSLFVDVAFVAVVVLLVHGGIVTSEVTASQNAASDQHERHPRFVNLGSSSAAVAKQAHLELRRGEWYAVRSARPAEFDEEQAHLGWRAGK